MENKKSIFFLTKEMVEQAVDIATPSIEMILECDDAVWGPRYVVVVVPYLITGGKMLFLERVIGNQPSKWSEEWKISAKTPVDFFKIAYAKFKVSLRTGLSSTIVVESFPWFLVKGDYFYPGCYIEEGLAASVSGAYGETDHGIAEIIVACLKLVCQLKKKHMQLEGIVQV